MNRQVIRSINIATAVLCSGLSAVCAIAQADSGGAQTPPRVRTMRRHGLAGVVKSVSGSQIVMGIPENVDLTVQISSATHVSDQGQDVPPDAIRIGDAIFASGDVDEETHTIQAQAVAIQSGQALQMLETLRANFGRAWTAGVTTSVHGDSIVLKRMDGQSQTFAVDSGTIYRLNDQPADRATLSAGERVRAQFRPGGSVASIVTIQGLAGQNQAP